MKKIFAFLAALTLAVSAFAQSGKEIYNKYSDLPGFSAVYVSPAMFRMIGRIPDVDIQDDKVNFGSIIKSMSGFYLLSAENNPAAAQDLYKDVNRMMDRGKYELLLEAKEDGEATRLYTVGDAKTVTALVMLTKSGDEITYISIDGKMDREKLEKLLAETAEDGKSDSGDNILE